MRKLLSWLPVAILGLALVGCWGVVLAGGYSGVFAWYAVQLLGLAAAAILVVTALAVIVVALVRRRRPGPAALAFLALLLPAAWPAAWVFGVGIIPYPTSAERSQPAATVRLPANVPLQVVWGGEGLDANYHAIAPDQRWAYDFTVPPQFNGSSRVEDYGCYGVPVVAPAAGLVAVAHDGEPDQVPGQLSNNTTAPEGNYVAIEMSTGTYLVIAHLKPGTVTVKTGQRVEEGVQIGECGNSGNTSEPHIHMHHQRQNPAETPIGLAEGLPLYFRDTNGPAMPRGGFDVVDGTPIPRGPLMVPSAP